MALILTCVLTLAIIYLVYLFYSKSVKLTITCLKTLRNKKILSHTPSLTDTSYTPTPYLLGGNLQTIYYALAKEFLPEGDVYPCQREIVPLKDGGQTSVDWVCCPEIEETFSAKTPILVLLPGLTGDRYDEYVKVIINEACRRKFKCVVLNHRGCGHTPLTTPKLYCGNSTEDTKAAVEAIKRRFPDNPLYGVGTSLGGTLLGNLIAKDGEKTPFKATALICAGFEFYLSIKHMEKTMFGLYNFALGYCLKKKLREHRKTFEPLIQEWGMDIDKEIEKIKGIRDFDKLVTARLQGYGIPDNYYRTASLGQRLKDIRIPTLLLSSIDDPVISYLLPHP
eukprot:TRINITY_DN880_c0_g1_i6.p1 TRINITY_DN880_c0_g1~~TRINITY_DN880_c0_g1_i6.p1  ORF type:complete len:337 (-),score=67.18 TRINITY_DN880_c0_g1_i6:262-1272(-)